MDLSSKSTNFCIAIAIYSFLKTTVKKLLDVAYKIFGRLLNNRLTLIAKGLIEEEQLDSIKGRFIINGIFIIIQLIKKMGI